MLVKLINFVSNYQIFIMMIELVNQLVDCDFFSRGLLFMEGEILLYLVEPSALFSLFSRREHFD